MEIEVGFVQAAVACERCSSSWRSSRKHEYRQEALDFLKEQFDRLVERQVMGLTTDDEDIDQHLDFINSMGEECLLCLGKDKMIAQTVRALLDAPEELGAEKKENQTQFGNVLKLPGHQKEHRD